MEGETTEREAVEGEPVEDVDKEDFVPAGPQPIKRLSTDVINQIAAAEIIHRPSNAIKELIENSLDAGSTSIKLTIKDGGLKLIQIADNGHGINKTDLALLCTRYATSKLRQFEDLQSLVTYGFRGEALASISYCSHVEVITKIRSEGCGWKANYSDGVMIPPKPGVTADPKPAAANDGTVISAEDLFYNMPLRKRAFKSPSDEYNRILDVIQKYAVHNPHVSWVCKKAGTSLPDISTPVDSTSKAVIALLYTPSLAADLLEVPLTTLRPEDKLGAKVRGWVSSANTNWARRGGWLLFINNRLVDSSKMKKAVDSLYTAYLAKGASPWIYLSLEIQPEKVDVNVHPTKSDVHFLNEDEMIEAVVGVIQSTLANANISRSFSVQTLLPGASEPSQKGAKKVDSTPAADSATASQRKPAPNYKVRIDPSSRTLDSMIRPTDSTQLSTFTQQVPVLQSDDEHPRKKRGVNGTGDDVDGAIEVSDEDQDESSNGQSDDGRERVMQWDETPGKGRTSAAEIEESACEFTSIRELRREMRKKGCAELNEIMTRHSFVGIADTNLCLSLIQFSTKLFLVNHASLGDEHFYQIGLRQFGAFHRIKLEPAPSLSDLLEIAIEDEGDKIRSNGLDTTKVHAGVLDLLMDKREMVDEYFSLRITEDGLVETLPLILKGYMPNLDRLPHFLLCLATEADWTDEKACFDSILKELAFFYSPRPASDHVEDALAQGDGTESEEAANQRWQLEHVLFPSFRKHTQWPKEVIGPHVQQVANLPDLFRIFERC